MSDGSIAGQTEGKTAPRRGYLLCSVERTGSSLLAGALTGTGVGGRPLEYFNPVEQEQPWMRSILGESRMPESLPKVLIAGSTPNGVFGAKLHWPHLRFAGMQVDGAWSEAERTRMHDLMDARRADMNSLDAALALLRAHFSDLRPQATGLTLFRSHMPELRFVWLKRRNMVARAISMHRARKSDVWFRSANQLGPTPAETKVEFDLAEIHKLYCMGVFQEESWQRIFMENNISPLCLEYEELVADYEPTVRRTLAWLGLDGGEVVIQRPVSAKQSDVVSEEWERRYRACFHGAVL